MFLTAERQILSFPIFTVLAHPALAAGLVLIFSCAAAPFRPAVGFAAKHLGSQAEITHYTVQKNHYRVPLQGTAVGILVKEFVHPETYVKTNQATGRIPAWKSMLMVTLPSMNWDHRDNAAMYMADDLRPLKLAVTGEEWCGNNFLEWHIQGNDAHLIGRPYTDDVRPVNETAGIRSGYYLHEQLSVLVRGVAATGKEITVRMMPPQTAYLPPVSKELQVTITPKGADIVTAGGKTYKVAQRIEVTAAGAGAAVHMPHKEVYWLHETDLYPVKIIRNYAVTQMGKRKVSKMTLELESVQVIDYWQAPVEPAGKGLAARRRATQSSMAGLNIFYKFASKKISPENYIASLKKKGRMPGEYISKPSGNFEYSPGFTGQGGWYFDAQDGLFKPNINGWKYPEP